MSRSFQSALEAQRATSRLGDVWLRYEPSMLVGETPKPRQSVRPTVLWIGGVAALLLGVAALLVSAPLVVVGLLIMLGATGLVGASWLERLEKRQRRFVLNFQTVSLRLDFASPIAGAPQTLVVPFDDVTDLQLVPQVDGTRCLVVDFRLDDKVLREVLVAYIGEKDLEAAERLERVLHGAFGLGEAPGDDPAENFDQSSFEG